MKCPHCQEDLPSVECPHCGETAPEGSTYCNHCGGIMEIPKPVKGGDDWDSRILCSDGTCIGIIGPDGKCKECGKPYRPGAEDEDEVEEAPSADEAAEEEPAEAPEEEAQVDEEPEETPEEETKAEKD